MLDNHFRAVATGSPSGLRADRLVELAEMTDRLARVMQADYIPIWLNRPLETLDDEKPVEVLARGEYRRIAIPHDHHLWRVDLELGDLSTAAPLARVDLPLPAPWRRSWAPFEAVGEQLYQDVWNGLIAPSAARPNALIVCIFDRGIWPPAGCEPLRATEITEAPAPPTGMTT